MPFRCSENASAEQAVLTRMQTTAHECFFFFFFFFWTPGKFKLKISVMGRKISAAMPQKRRILSNGLTWIYLRLAFDLVGRAADPGPAFFSSI